MNNWDMAMLALAPLLRGHQMLRTWVALVGASVATFFVYDPIGYLAIDAIAAAIVVARPSGLAQKAIGAMFTLMIFFDLGFYLSPQNNWTFFVFCLSVAGWVQWAILAGWTGHDLWRRYSSWSNPVGGASHPIEGRIQ